MDVVVDVIGLMLVGAAAGAAASLVVSRVAPQWVPARLPGAIWTVIAAVIAGLVCGWWLGPRFAAGAGSFLGALISTIAVTLIAFAAIYALSTRVERALRSRRERR